MRILFLDQSGELGGAELFLVDLAESFKDRCLVGLFADGPHRRLLEQTGISVQVLTAQSLNVRKNSSMLQGLSSMRQLVPLIATVAKLSQAHNLIYANTQKALVVGALASAISRRPLVFHLHDILSADHFSATNRRIIVALANRAVLVIANSQASQTAFIAAGGRADITTVVYNGFKPENYKYSAAERSHLRQQLGIDQQFVVGHFSRLSPWKGQHILLEALARCPEHVMAILVGDALFGEQAYVEQLHQQIDRLGLQHRVRFLGFRSDVPQLMTLCDLVAHTSTAPEPFGRVIVESMLCGTPIVAAAAGGVVELIEPGKTGWLAPPGDPLKLAEIIQQCHSQPEQAAAIAQKAQEDASQRFDLNTINRQISQLLDRVV